MSGIQFVTDGKGRKVAVQIDLKKYGSVLEEFWDGLISESRRTTIYSPPALPATRWIPLPAFRAAGNGLRQR